ncbi:MAG: KH domain-containing protein [Chloroflexota bacterium]
MEDDAVEISGRTVEDAIAQAERQLGVDRNDLSIDVLTQGSRGVFGIGAENARIQVRPRQRVTAAVIEDIPAVRPSLSPSSEPEDDDANEDMDTLDSPNSTTVRPAPDNADLAEAASTVLRQLLTTMGFDADVSVRSINDPLMIAITGENLGVLIGRRGDNLAALQFMVNLILSKNRRQWPKVVIDVENYRARREESLQTLAERIAYRVKRNGRPFTLEAMPASDRRVIHLALREQTGIETYSIGEGVSRRVVIAPQRAGNNGSSEPHYR